MKSHRSTTTMAMLAMALAVSACKGQREQGLEEHGRNLDACAKKLAESPLIPIIGGGYYLDTRHFAFNVPSVVYEQGECGTDTFVANFWWTGQKIVPDAEKFTGYPPGQVPGNWRLFQVGAKLGNLRYARACQANPTAPNCSQGQPPGYPPSWPAELVVRPKNYPGLEIWMSEMPPKGRTMSMSFVMPNWRRDDGRPRSVHCDIVDIDTNALTKYDLEELDFGLKRYPCQMEYWDFRFKHGAARVMTGTEALKDTEPGLRALNHYLSNAIQEGEAR